MKDKKSFFTGIVVGIAVIILFNTVSYFLPMGYAGSTEMNPGQKIDLLLKIINDNYIGEYKVEELKESMYFGLVSGVNDPYTTYLDKDTLIDFMKHSNGTFTGIGVQIIADTNDNTIKIVTAMPNSPSERAGILPNDKIIKVDDISVFGDDIDYAKALIQGEIGSTVTVTIFRESTGETFDLSITRDMIEEETVKHKIIDDRIGYIQITAFEEITGSQFIDVFNELQSQNIEGLIVDLRNNPGGLLHIVVQITDLLVPPGGNIVFTKDKNGKIVEEKSKKEHFGKPLVILVNENSASASEVLTGAVKDYGVGTIVGNTTFGKGIVQSLIKLKDGSAIKITTSEYFTPNGTSIHGTGIKPDIIVKIPEEKSYIVTTLPLEEDEQLLKAIEVINQKLD